MWIEIAATIFSLIGVYLTTKRVVWCWPISIIAVVLTTLVYWEANLMAEMSLQAYYLLAAVFGWVMWTREDSTHGTIKVQRFPLKYGYILGLIIFIAAVSMGLFFDCYTESDLPYLDSAIAAASLAATWMMVKRYLENWLLWIVIDSGCVGLYLYKELYWFAALFGLYTLLAVRGYRDWKTALNP